MLPLEFSAGCVAVFLRGNIMDNNDEIVQEKNEYEYELGRKESKAFKKGLLAGGILCIILVTVITYGILYSTDRFLVLGRHGVAVESDCKVLDDTAVDKIEEISNYIDLYYYEDVDTDDLKNGLYAGLMEGVNDKYSEYYTKKEYDELQFTTNGNYYGIGAGLSQDSKTMEVTISKIYEGTPSEEAGLKAGDKVLKVDGNDASSMSVSDLVKIVRGEEGTTVHIEVYRESTKENLEFDVERKNVELPSVSSKMLEDNMGYIQITEFQKGTAKQFKKALTKLEKDGMKGLIVDVRSNPGGLLSAVVEILDEILPEGIVLYTEDKYGNRQEYKSDASCVDFPIVVLVDENSASASEIFAGAIKDYKAGTLVGVKTFGKGIVQSIYPLEDGDALKITTAKYYTPSGNYIHGVGIEPDIEIEYKYSGSLDGDYDMKYDNQAQKAIEVLSEKIK